jgi:hypothetical protein
MAEYAMSETRDTVPAPPVPSTNPIAELRRELEESRVNIRSTPTRYHGVQQMDDGTMHDMTPPIFKFEIAQEWIRRARHSISYGSAFPDFCRGNHLQTTPGLCEQCLSGTGKK